MTMGHSIAATFGLYFAFIAICYPVFAEQGLEIEVTAEYDVDTNVYCLCMVSPATADLQWIFKGHTINENNRTIFYTSNILEIIDTKENKKWLQLTINNLPDVYAGNYACVAKLGDKVENKSISLTDIQLGSCDRRLVNKTVGPLRLNASEPHDIHVMMYCLFEAYEKPEIVRWYKKNEPDKAQFRLQRPNGLKQINSTYNLHITAEDNGTYVCELEDKVAKRYIQGEIDIFVYDKPKIISFNAIPVNTTQIYINWTVNTYNSEIEMYSLFIRERPACSNSSYSLYTKDKIGYRSHVINGLKKSTEYQLKLEVKTKGWYATDLWVDTNVVKTLDKEPVFVPNITLKGFSATSVTIDWPPPPEDIADLIHYYILEAWKDDKIESYEAYYPRDSRNLPYMYGHLDPHSTYVFRVRACSEYTIICYPWSEEMIAATLNRIPGKPSNIHFSFGEGYMNITGIPL